MHKIKYHQSHLSLFYTNTSIRIIHTEFVSQIHERLEVVISTHLVNVYFVPERNFRDSGDSRYGLVSANESKINIDSENGPGRFMADDFEKDLSIDQTYHQIIVNNSEDVLSYDTDQEDGVLGSVQAAKNKSKK